MGRSLLTPNLLYPASKDITLALVAAALALVLSEALSLTGVLPAPHLRAWVMIRDGHMIHDVGSLALHFALMFFCVRPGWRHFLVALGIGTIINLVAFWLRPWWGGGFWHWVNSLGFGYGLASIMILVRWRWGGYEIQKVLATRLLGAAAVLTLYVYCVHWYLAFTAKLHPSTFDVVAYKIDGTFGFQPSVVAAAFAQFVPHSGYVLNATYLLLPYGFSLLYALGLRQRRLMPVSMFAVFTISAATALLLYHLCPISGPSYAFGRAFPLAMPDPASFPLQAAIVPPAARNGMPSWHVGWALILWFNARHTSPFVRNGFMMFFLLTLLATLALGEHYLVDVIAAIPAAIAMQAACNRELNWRAYERWRVVVVCGVMAFAWILGVRYGGQLLLQTPGLSWAIAIATIVASVLLYSHFLRATDDVATRGAIPDATAPSAMPHVVMSREVRYGVWMFVLSGFAALVYQVLFSKVLGLTFGSQAMATYTVLAVYMGGMALGAWLGGRLAQSRGDALKLYAWCEGGIGLYCLATPVVFAGIQSLYVWWAGGTSPDAGVLTLLRVVLGAVALLVPTVLMGATLPILARFFESRAASLGTSVAMLYGANTVGAGVGALLAGYAIIPALGVWKTTLVAAGLNFVVVWLALRLAGRQSGTVVVPVPQAVPGAAVLNGTVSRRLGWLALVVLGVGGMVTLALEVNYIHLLAVVAGNSVYAFSLMLFAFLMGLAAGAEAMRRLLKLDFSLLLMLAWLEFALAAVILGGVFLWEGLPQYFASFSVYPLQYGFGAREVVRAAVCFVAMFPPAVMIGALYPLAMECVGRSHPEQSIAALGRAAALNTVGNVAGVLLAGFWLLPMIGALRSIQLLALVCLALGVIIVVVGALARRPLAWAPAALVVALLAVQPRSFDYTALASGANVYFAAQNYGRAIDHAESLDGGLTTVARHESDSQVLTLLTNGKFQGTNDLKGEGMAQVGFALSPLLHTDARDRALVIGFGTGMSARTLHAAGFRELDIVDLSADILRLAHQYFGSVNDRILAKPGVRSFVTDGRNFLLLQRHAYDVVSMEVSSIWFAGAASLYNREFYQLVKRRLTPNGVLQQWMQLHHIYPQDLLYILGSVRAEFRYVWLYLIGGQGMIIAADDVHAMPRDAYVRAIDGRDTLAPLLKLHGGSANNLRETLLLDPVGIERLLASSGLPSTYWVSTDDNLRLEYSTPKGNVLDGFKSLEYNTMLLKQSVVTPQLR